MTESLLGGASAAPLSMRATAVAASAVVRAARQLFTDLERSRRIDATSLRNAMEAAFGASDASGAWNWKTAYDACEATTVLFLRRYGLFTEIISWKLRMFVPLDTTGPAILAKVLEGYPLFRISGRTGA
jgi:hypothetical protein